MTALNFLFNLGVSLFVAPTPGLLLLIYAHGGAAIPPLQGGIVMVVSAAAYWAWLINRRNRRQVESQAARARSVDIGRPDTFLEGMAATAARTPAAAADEVRNAPVRSADERRRADAALRGHEDLADPLALASHRAPAEVLIDRVADLRQLKALVAEHEVGLLNAFHRTVARDEFGAPDYSDWAYEADRFLLSSAFMARTLNRHEAIATVTAEVEFLSRAGRRGSSQRRDDRHARPAALLPAPGVADLGGVQLSATGAQAAPAANPWTQTLPESIRRRLAGSRDESPATVCARILDEHGWVTQATDSPGSDAIDLFAERGEMVIGLRCRPGEGSVTDAVIRDVVGARERFGLDGAGIVAREVSKSARALATVNGIFLLDEDDLNDLHLYLGHRRKVVPLFRTAQG